MPLANLPMTLAVHGATSSSAMPSAIAMCSMSAFMPGPPLRRDHRTPRDRLEGHRPDEPRRRARHHGDDVVPALLQPAAHLDRLVGADAAGDAEGDQRPSSARSSSIFSTLRSQHFALRDGDLLLAVLARHGAAQQLPRPRAGDDDELEPVFLRLLLACLNVPMMAFGRRAACVAPAPARPARSPAAARPPRPARR